MSDNNKQKQDIQEEAENSPKDEYKDKNTFYIICKNDSKKQK